MGQSLGPQVRIFDTLDELAEEVSRNFAGLITSSISEHGRFSLVLSGGETPRAIYRYIAANYSDAVPWEKVLFYFGDERYVPHTDTSSNYRMTRESLLDTLAIKSENVFPMPTKFRRPQDAAADYERTLRSKFHGPWPYFDLVLLGLGADGHTASLFPGSGALHEKGKWVTVAQAPDEPKTRLTLTLPAINHAPNIFFIVTGEKKSSALRDALSDDVDIDSCPAAAVRPHDGSLIWWVDKSAASLLVT